MTDPPTKRRWLWLVVVPLVPVVLLVVLGAIVVAALRPEAADPTLTKRSRSLPTRTTADALQRPVGCSLTVYTLKGRGTEAFTDVAVTGRLGKAVNSEVVFDDNTGADGVLTVEAAPCEATLWIEAEAGDWGDTHIHTYSIAEGGNKVLTLYLKPTFELTGTVTDGDGASVAGAKVRVLGRGEAHTVADDAGRYSVRLAAPPQAGTYAIHISADSLGLAEASQLVHLVGPEGESEHEAVEAAAGDVVTVDLTLERRREVAVYCAGLPDDSCQQTMLMCTAPLLPIGETCDFDDGEGAMVCPCGEGTRAVRGGGRSVLIDADDTEAWLDFRDAGTIVGRVLGDGLPLADCLVMALRVPTGLEDLPRGGFVGHQSECDAEGGFVIEGLVPGDWELVAGAEVADLGRRERTLAPTQVRARRTNDVGDIEMLGGGGISGRLVDGLTGQVVSGEPLLLLRPGEGGGRTTPTFAESGGDGSFLVEGLPPGEWVVSHFLSPHVRTVVTVEDGAITDGVVVETSDATALETNGFSLGSESGALVVTDVTDGPAAEAGLEPGDHVTGVLIGGFDLSGPLGPEGGTFMRAVLGHWDGPGVTLVVEREVEDDDGEVVFEELEVALDW